jgi:hypothetical protein
LRLLARPGKSPGDNSHRGTGTHRKSACFHNQAGSDDGIVIERHVF